MTTVTMPKVATPSLMTDQVFAAIHEAIMRGELPAGYRLRIRDIAAQVGTSVMPVREAIRRLEEAGLAERVPNKGAVVKGHSLEDLIHVYDVRRLLETEAARQGGREVSATDVDAMQGHCERMRQAVADGDVIGALDADEALLEALYRAGGNPVLVEMIRALWQRCRPYKVAGARRAAAESDDSLWSFQPRIVEAARAKDHNALAALTKASLLSARRRIQKLLAEQRESGAKQGSSSA